MTFLTLVFLTLALIILVKGNLLNESIRSLPNEDEIKLLNKNEQLLSVMKVLLIMTWWFVHTLLWILYLIKALSVDIYIFPTLIMIAIYILTWVSFFIKKERKNKLKPEFTKINIKDRTFWRTAESIIEIIYFGYMLWILLF